jgi:4-hydroxy-tetrahydrodipicolinate reductase
MLFLVLGRGKTGSVVAEVASERGHGVRVLGEEANVNGSALTAPFLAGFDAVIDFTTPEAVIPNLKACLATGACVVVGTTGWYSHLQEMRAMADRRRAGLLYGTNFSIGVQALLKVAKALAGGTPGYEYSITETHHTGKLDVPSGTALTIQQVLQTASPGIEVKIESRREGDAPGTHIIHARSSSDLIELKHESFSRRGFAEGAVRAAEWLAGRVGSFDFHDVYDKMAP